MRCSSLCIVVNEEIRLELIPGNDAAAEMDRRMGGKNNGETCLVSVSPDSRVRGGGSRGWWGGFRGVVWETRPWSGGV